MSCRITLSGVSVMSRVLVHVNVLHADAIVRNNVLRAQKFRRPLFCCSIFAMLAKFALYDFDSLRDLKHACLRSHMTIQQDVDQAASAIFSSDHWARRCAEHTDWNHHGIAATRKNHCATAAHPMLTCAPKNTHPSQCQARHYRVDPRPTAHGQGQPTRGERTDPRAVSGARRRRRITSCALPALSWQSAGITRRVTSYGHSRSKRSMNKYYQNRLVFARAPPLRQCTSIRFSRVEYSALCVHRWCYVRPLIEQRSLARALCGFCSSRHYHQALFRDAR